MVVALIISALLIVTGARVADGNRIDWVDLKNLLLLSHRFQITGNCSPCEPPPKHYDEFNCTGVVLKQGQCCPVK